MSFEEKAFEPTGPTIVIAGATTAPDGVLLAKPGVTSKQIRIHNSGAVVAWLAHGENAAGAKAAAVIPTSTPTNVTPLLPGSVLVMSAPIGKFWSVITASSTATVYIQPGRGL